MKRKLVCITLIYILGLIWGLYFNINIALIFCFIIGFLFCIKKNKFFFILTFVLLISCIYNNGIKNKYSLKYKNIQNVEVMGTIEKIQCVNEYSKQYVVKVYSINGDKKFKNTRLLIIERDRKYVKYNAEYGDFIKFNGALHNAKSNTNFKGFNYNEYLRSKKIYGIVEIENKDIKLYRKNSISVYKSLLNKLYGVVKTKIYQNLPEESADICIALILGDKSNIEDNVIENFSNSNLSHILAISGMHMTYIILIISFLFKFFDKKGGIFFTIIIIIVFCNFVGNSDSIVRATIMAVIFLSGKLLHKKSDSITSLAISSLVILIINPYAIKSISFVLSVSGTLGIILFYKIIKNKLDFITIFNKNKITKYIKESMSLSMSANIIIIPIVAVYFNKISFIFIFSNLFANLCLSIIMPLIFGFIISTFISNSITKFLSHILNLFLLILISISKISSKAEFFNFIVCTPSIFTIIVYYIVISLFFIKQKVKFKFFIMRLIRFLVIVYLIISIVFYFIKYMDKNMYIYFVDVGQGDCTLVITKYKKTILIDGGGSEFGDDYVGRKILLPYLLDRNIKKLDYVLISHFDADHCKAILYIMEQLEVKNVIISKQGKMCDEYNKFIDIVNKKGINVISVKSSMKVIIDQETYFDILWPENNLINENVLNNNSIVAKLNYKKFSMLFTGDIELIAEKKISEKNNLKSTVLKVAHHGSKSSSNIFFLESVKPEIALIGVGENNKYGHPSEEVINRFNKMRS